MLNEPLILGLVCQLLSLIALALAISFDKPRQYRYRRMAFILGVGLLLFGAALVDIQVML